MQAITMIPGIEWSRRSRVLAVAAFVTLGLVLVFGSTPAHAAQLTVSWSDATPDDHTGFKVERKTGTTGAFAQVATTGATVMSYTDTTVTAGTTYCYRVRAYNTVGDSPYTPEGCAAPAPTPVRPDPHRGQERHRDRHRRLQPERHHLRQHLQRDLSSPAPPSR